MSRGPGVWQRAILAALAEHDVVPVRDLCAAVAGRPLARPELVAARRAAHRLAEAGTLRVISPWYCWHCQTVLRSMAHPACAQCPPGLREKGAAGLCPWCHGMPGRALAVTRDPLVMADCLRGTAEATTIPARLSVASIRPAHHGSTCRPTFPGEAG